MEIIRKTFLIAFILQKASPFQTCVVHLCRLLNGPAFNLIFLLFRQVVLNGHGDYPDKDFRMSKEWEVAVRLMPDAKDNVLVKGHIGLFHRTYNDGMASISQVKAFVTSAL